MERKYDILLSKIKKQVRKYGKNTKYVLYPFGDLGATAKGILNGIFNIQEAFIIDNKLAQINDKIFPIEYLKTKDCSDYIFFITSDSAEYYNEIRHNILQYVSKENVVDLFPKTQKGKYSYGPLCDHWLVEKVGAFCSFAIGTDVVENHPSEYISTHPFLYYGVSDLHIHEYSCHHDAAWYFPEVSPSPHANVKKLNKIVIGNDVWLGKNVIITNSANIGNGVIAGAGSVITKDVPDYAVVGGVPAKIIRYRYTQEQIKQLNTIAWWNWPDEKIRSCYNDFYIDIDEFIRKHGKPQSCESLDNSSNKTHP